MTRETKIGLLVGMGVILFIGILISDYLSSAQQQTPADLTELDRQSAPPPAPVAERQQALPMPQPLPAGRDPQNGTRFAGRDNSRNTQQHQLVGPIWRVEDPQGGQAFQADVLTQQTDVTRDRQSEQADAIGGAGPGQAQSTGAAGDLVHHVQPGETLASIARRYYGSDDYYMTIYEANRDKMSSPNVVRTGVRLVIPNRAGAADLPAGTHRGQTPSPVPRYATYTVQRGDTLSVIAQRFYGSVRDMPKLIELNRDKIDDPDWVPVGTVLKVPADAELASR